MVVGLHIIINLVNVRLYRSHIQILQLVNQPINHYARLPSAPREDRVRLHSQSHHFQPATLPQLLLLPSHYRGWGLHRKVREHQGKLAPFRSYGSQGSHIQYDRSNSPKTGNHGPIYTEHPTEPNDLKVINLSSYDMSLEEVEVLSLGLSFCVEQHFDTFEVIKDVTIFARNILLKTMYSKETNQGSSQPVAAND